MKHDLTKRRTCTFGLHGPWGESSLVFIRVTFTFPRNYPQATYPDGIPIIDLERNPLISLKDRTFMLRRLTAIREHRRPCLESCLRFLLFRDEEERMPGEPLRMMDQGESSSSDEGDDDGLMRNAKGIGGTGGGGAAKKTRDGTGILRGNKNLVEPRTSQGTFGPNGEIFSCLYPSQRLMMFYKVNSYASSEILQELCGTCCGGFRIPPRRLPRTLLNPQRRRAPQKPLHECSSRLPSYQTPSGVWACVRKTDRPTPSLLRITIS